MILCAHVVTKYGRRKTIIIKMRYKKIKTKINHTKRNSTSLSEAPEFPGSTVICISLKDK